VHKIIVDNTTITPIIRGMVQCNITKKWMGAAK